MFSRTLLLLVVACLLNNGVLSAKIKGMAWATGHDLWGIKQPFAQKSLNILKSTGINYVHISAYTEMTHKGAWGFIPETDDYSIRYQIRMMKRNGLKVFFKPVVEVRGDVWRGFIDNGSGWLMKVYRPYILKMAVIARQEGVDLFAVGSEYVATLKYTQAWREIIRQVRTVYYRKVTYVANHDSFEKCKFWDAVDVISISAYFVLVDFHKGTTYGWSPNMWYTKYLWNQKAHYVNKWRKKRGYWNKQILIAEVGAQSKGGGVVYRKPYLWTAAAGTNFWEQEKMYEGILSAFMPKPWCAGVILWNWELKPHSDRWEPFRSGYTPQNKPAMKRMKKYFLWRWYP